MKISGTFSVKLEPLESSIKAPSEYQAARFSLHKTFEGPMSGTAVGEMLALGSVANGAGGYVASDLFTVTVEGRKGSFVIQHLGTRTKTSQQLRVEVVPESATGELTGLTGTLGIRIENGHHFYDFDYQLPPR